MSALQGKAAIVTGAASGIGRAVAQRLQDDGMDVLAVDLKPDPDGPGTPFEADLTNAEANENAVKAALEKFGRLDVVVANAGIQHVSPIEEFPVEKWNTILALLLTSPFLLARYAWPALKSSGAGRFVAIASVHGLVASPYKIAYISAKHGVIGLARRSRWRGPSTGSPRTPSARPTSARRWSRNRSPTRPARTAFPRSEVIEKVILQPHAVKELIEPAEVAGVVAFLVGPEGRTFTGAPVTLDQGWTAR